MGLSSVPVCNHFLSAPSPIQSCEIPCRFFLGIVVLRFWEMRSKRTFTRRIQRLHIEDIHTLHLSQNFEALESGCLFQVCGYGSGGCARGEEVGFGFYFCAAVSTAFVHRLGEAYLQT